MTYKQVKLLKSGDKVVALHDTIPSEFRKNFIPRLKCDRVITIKNIRNEHIYVNEMNKYFLLPGEIQHISKYNRKLKIIQNE